MNEVFILDACALIALINKEDGTEIVEDILRRGIQGSATVMINKLNLLEVYYDAYRNYGKDPADKLVKNINQPPIVIQSELSEAVFKEAGRLKAMYKISLADSVALAEASVLGGTLLTSDHHELEAVEKSEKIKFQWIR